MKYISSMKVFISVQVIVVFDSKTCMSFCVGMNAFII